MTKNDVFSTFFDDFAS